MVSNLLASQRFTVLPTKRLETEKKKKRKENTMYKTMAGGIDSEADG